MILGNDARPDEAPVDAEAERLEALVGAEGTALTDLRPVGTIRVEGERRGFWFGLGHDAVVRIRPGRTDVRVTARTARAQGDEACRRAAAVARGLAADQPTGE
jgi:hypothetical protein